ncbi:MAG: BatD family protein [Bacteriovoracia bacterium]
MNKTGKLTFFILLLFTFAVNAADLEVIPSSTEITEDENLSLEFRTSIEGSGGTAISKPTFDAPDFDQVNVYSQSTGIESSIINGQVTVRQTSSIIVVLHPKKQGTLSVKNIRVKAGKENLEAPDLEIKVLEAGAINHNSRGGRNQRSQFPHQGISPAQEKNAFLLKTEPSKIKVYKGEQITLTYAIYTRTQIMSVQVERYPTVPGFLKEDLDIPVLGQRLNYSQTVLNGRPYNKAILAQYAIFPVKEGTLSIDPFTAKFTTRAGRMNLFDDDDDDPFGMNRFFRALQPRTITRSSDRVQVEVLPLPPEGRPANFSGLVGDFSVTSVVDKYSLKAGEPLNVKVKVEGKGHVGSLEHLNVEWPKDFELYEDKSNMNFQKTGYSDRVFDFMLIPRAKGHFQIPAIEVSMFNPQTKTYLVRKTDPIDIEVLEGGATNIYTPKTEQKKEEYRDIRYWRDEISNGFESLGKSIVWSKYFVGLSIILLIAGLIVSFLKTGTAASSLWLFQKALTLKKESASKKLLAEVKKLAKTPTTSQTAYELLRRSEEILASVLQQKYSVQIGSQTREQVKQQLESKEVPHELAVAILSLLEHCENIRFMPPGSQALEPFADKAKTELEHLVDRLLT